MPVHYRVSLYLVVFLFCWTLDVVTEVSKEEGEREGRETEKWGGEGDDQKRGEGGEGSRKRGEQMKRREVKVEKGW